MVERGHMEDFRWNQKNQNRQLDHPDVIFFYFSTFLRGRNMKQYGMTWATR